MIHAPARPHRRWQLRAHSADPVIDQLGTRLAIIVTAGFAVAMAVMAVQYYLVSPSSIERPAAAAGSISLAVPRVPARQVEQLERVDLSTVVSNPTKARVENLALELLVRDSAGVQVLSSRQAGISLQPNDSRAIYWQWRIPGALHGGSYTVQVVAFDASGNRLGNEQPPTAQLLIRGN